jgi:hypothetical protein
MALNYFAEEKVYDRLGYWADEEGKIIQGLEIRAALH